MSIRSFEVLFTKKKHLMCVSVGSRRLSPRTQQADRSVRGGCFRRLVRWRFQSVRCPSQRGFRLIGSFVGCSKMTEKRQGPSSGVRFMEVSVKRELTVLCFVCVCGEPEEYL